MCSALLWCFNFKLFAPFFLGDWGAYLYHVTLIKVARIVSTQKENRAARLSAARLSAARFIARHIEVETPRLTLNHGPNLSAPPRRCWVGNAASSVCAVGQRTLPAEVQSEPHLPSDVVLGQLVTERIGLENGIVLSFSS